MIKTPVLRPAGCGCFGADAVHRIYVGSLNGTSPESSCRSSKLIREPLGVDENDFSLAGRSADSRELDSSRGVCAVLDSAGAHTVSDVSQRLTNPILQSDFANVPSGRFGPAISISMMQGRRSAAARESQLVLQDTAVLAAC